MEGKEEKKERWGAGEEDGGMNTEKKNISYTNAVSHKVSTQ